MRWPVLAALALALACNSPDTKTDDDGFPDARPSGGADAVVAVPDAPIQGGGPDAPIQTGGNDPAPQAAQPGEYNCPGCPDITEPVETDITAGAVTSYAFAGTVTGAQGNGTFYIDGPGTQESFGPIETNPDGSFAFEAPLFCGEQLVKCLWSNTAGTYVLVVRVITENCVEADIRVTLSWDGLGRDWELHLVKPGGRINDPATDCTWDTCIGARPDWGVQGDATDDPKKDVDNTGDYGPENIFLARPEAGVYTVLVEHWGGGDPMSDGQVIFNVGGEVTVARIENLAPMHVWTAGTIRWPEKTVTTGTTIFDCSAMWGGGCNAPLP
jgi:hypothetical protein